MDFRELGEPDEKPELSSNQEVRDSKKQLKDSSSSLSLFGTSLHCSIIKAKPLTSNAVLLREK